MAAALHPDDCGCCGGVDVDTPMAVDNAPGLSSIAYRVGTHGTFRETMEARLSSSDFPALAGLRSRDDDDFTIALVDGFAVMADVLTFYQERIANEAFMRSATERRSVLELARLLGYTLDPGVAADAWLAFTLESAPGSPANAALPVTIGIGTKVQSVPGPDEAPQTFETVSAITARVDRNAITVQTRARQVIGYGDRQLELSGTGHQLAPGDVILIVGAERVGDPGSEQWDIRPIESVQADDRRDSTRVTWLEPLGHVTPHVEPSAEQTNVFVFRHRASLFGHNAPDPRLLSSTGTGLSELLNDAGDWDNFGIQDQHVDLDQQYPKVVAGSWIALVSAAITHQPSPLPGYKELYRATTVDHRSRADFSLASKITRVALDTAEHLSWYPLRETLVLTQSEELPLGERQLRSPLYGDRVALATIVPDLAPGQHVAVTGKRQHVRVADGADDLQLAVDGGTVALSPGDRLVLAASPMRTVAGASQQVDPEELTAAIDQDDPAPLDWALIDADGRPGTLTAGADAWELDPAVRDDPTIAEVVAIAEEADGVEHDRERTTLRMESPVRFVYDRETVTINANVAAATHGETVGEILGSGNAARRDQEFVLKQAPLTHVSAPTPSGRRSTLEVRVNDTLWTERSSLYAADASERSYVARTNDEGATKAVFGDGNEGARLPTGQQNLRARYRKGIGAAGNVRAGQLTTLLTMPLGVTGVTNPEAAAGGEDPEALADARRNAPLTVLTLERAVSRRDYEDFARGFSGISKAHALWIPSGPARGVFVTVAGPHGADVVAGSATHRNLTNALRSYGDALLALDIRSHRAMSFVLRAEVKVAPDRVADEVLALVREALETAFGFEAREFGQPVSIDEVVAVAHRVAGVVAVDVDELRRIDDADAPLVRPRLQAGLPEVSAEAVSPAELLTIDPARLELTVMP